MGDMFTFERSAWDILSDSLQNGSRLSAVRFLTALEQEDETVVEDAFQELLDKHVTLDVSALPACYGTGEQETRLRLEEKLVKSPNFHNLLEPGDPLRLYLEELAMTPAQGDPVLLAQQLAAGEAGAAEKLVPLYLNLAVSAACRHVGRGVLLLDLIQEAGLGLWQAILCYTGGDFDAHAAWWIDQSLARILTLQARENGVVNTMRQAMEDFRAADARLLTDLGRNATLEEIALEMGVSPEQAEVVSDMIQSAKRMETVKKEPAGETLEDQQAVEDTAYFQSRQRIGELLSGLSETEAQLLSLRFGLEGGTPESPESAGSKLGLTAQEVVAMEAAALAKLRGESFSFPQ